MYCLNVLRQCGINWNTSQYELYPPDENDLPINEQIQLVSQIFNGTMRDTINIESAQDWSISETMRWTGIEGGKEVVFYSEPYASFWQRLKVNMMRILPIDSML